MMICGDIFYQQLKLINSHAVADTINYLEMKFNFKTPDWDGLEKWAHFQKDDLVYDIPLTDDQIREEDHLNLTSGLWKIYLHGNKFDDGTVVKRVTTSIAALEVFPTGMLDGEPFPEIPASETERILARLDNIEKSKSVIVWNETNEKLTHLSFLTDTITEELPPSSNLLPPESLPKRINLTDGVTIEGNATLERHTPERIPFPYASVYVMLSPSYEGAFSSIVALLYYDENDAYLGYSTIKPTSVGTNFSAAVKTGTAHIRAWTNNGLAFEDVAISGEKITEWETYFPGGYAVREDALPWDTVRERTRPLYGKVIANFGDSIFGNKRPPKDISTALSDITGATVYNLGFGGCRMGAHHRAEYDAFSMYRLADSVASGDFALQDAVDVSSVSDMPSYFTKTRDLLKSIDWDKVDIVTIAYGTNDFTGGNTLDDAEDFGDYAYSLRYSIETLLTAYPHLKIFVCGQTYRFWFNDSGEFDYDSDTYTYKDHKLTDFVAKTAEVCAEYHLPFIDNYDGLGINKFNRGQYFPADDGTHHNAAGARLIAEHMARELF